jgi:O-antigen/teichoic acid export membrane protein
VVPFVYQTSGHAPKRYLEKAALVGSIATIGSAVAGLVLAPLIVRQVGLSTYGLWALLGMFSSLAGLGDLGIARACAYYIARTRSQRTASRVFYSDAAALGLVAAVLLLFGAALALWEFDGVFRMIDIPRSSAAPILACGLLILVISLGTGFLRGYLEATYRIHLNQVLLFVFQLANYGAVFAVSLGTADLLWLGVTTFGVHALILLLYLIVCHREGLPPICAPSVRILRILLGRSVGYLALGVLNVVTVPLNRIALLAWGGGSAHALFDLALKVAMAATSLLQVFNAPLFAVLARKGRKDRDSLSLVWRRVAISFLLYVAGMVTLAALAPLLAQVLVPQERSLLVPVLIALVGGVAFTGVSEPVMRAFWAWGWERKAARIRLASFVANVGLLFTITGVDPSLAVSLAYAFPLFAGSIVMLAMLSRGTSDHGTP